MTGFQQFLAQADAIGLLVAGLLLAMSVSAWVVILWKGWVLHRVHGYLASSIQRFWQASDLAAGQQQLSTLDHERVLLPLVEAAQQRVTPGSLEARALPHAQLTRRLRDTLHDVLARLQAGQVLLASVGAVSPFVGLFGTVWGIYHAMLGISAEGAASLEKIAGPVGEALIMTAAGLAVAIPAVLAFNVFGRLIAACEADLEGFAHDLRETLSLQDAGAAAANR
jgi:biopolymer transport protein ExbB